MEKRRSKKINGWKSIAVVAAILFGLFLISLTPPIETFRKASLFLIEMAPTFPVRPLQLITAKPKVQEVSFASGCKCKNNEKTIKADIYYAEGNSNPPAVMLIQGLTSDGKKNKDLVNIASTLGRLGYLAFVPEFEDLNQLKMTVDSVPEIVDSFYYMSKIPNIDAKKMDMVGFSYSSGLAMLAALDPQISDKIHYVAAFGGYYTTKDGLKFLTTRSQEYKGKVYNDAMIDTWARDVALRSVVETLPGEIDRRILDQVIFDADSGTDLSKSRTLLSKDGQKVFDLIINRDPNKFETIYQNLPLVARKHLEALNLNGKVAQIKARLFLIHSNEDEFIPFTESERIRDEAPNNVDFIEIGGFFIHVRETIGVTFTNIFTHYIPLGFQLAKGAFVFVWNTR